MAVFDELDSRVCRSILNRYVANFSRNTGIAANVEQVQSYVQVVQTLPRHSRSLVSSCMVVVVTS